MIFNFRPFIYSLFFILGLELIIFQSNFFFLILSVFLAVSIFEGRKIGGRWIFSILPFFFFLSASALLFLISTGLDRQIFIFICAFFYYLLMLGCLRLKAYENDRTARAMITAVTIVAIFFSYAGSYGLYLNFLVPLWVLMLTYLLITLCLSFQCFTIIEGNRRKVWTYSFLLALVMAEAIWAMNFWPFGYLTTGVIALIIYYVLWDLTQSYFLNLLSKKRVIANTVLFSVIVSFILLSAKWLPII